MTHVDPEARRGLPCGICHEERRVDSGTVTEPQPSSTSKALAAVPLSIVVAVVFDNFPLLVARAGLSLPYFPAMSQHTHGSSTANLVGVHYRVGKKIGEGSFGVIFEGASIILSFAGGILSLMTS